MSYFRRLCALGEKELSRISWSRDMVTTRGGVLICLARRDRVRCWVADPARTYICRGVHALRKINLREALDELCGAAIAGGEEEGSGGAAARAAKRGVSDRERTVGGKRAAGASPGLIQLAHGPWHSLRLRVVAFLEKAPPGASL